MTTTKEQTMAKTAESLDQRAARGHLSTSQRGQLAAEDGSRLE